MIVEVHEPIEVSAVFVRGRMRPVSFIWKHRHYKVASVTGVYRYVVGSSKCYGYTVGSGDDVYELSLNTGDMTWHLEKIHSAG